MAFTYDPTTDRGKVRLQIGDTDVADATRQLFTDAEIDAFLAMNTNIILLSAAAALEAIAANQLMVLKVIRNMDLSTDGAKMAKEFRELAKSLRKSWDDSGDGTYEGMFDWAEFADTRFAKRERIIKEEQRSG